MGAVARAAMGAYAFCIGAAFALIALPAVVVFGMCFLIVAGGASLLRQVRSHIREWRRRHG